ncbi:ChaN family lipoprotein [Grimontia kaedaensis]|uniref:ChaN family lipoprotein n=1 Tax=Grimontia kaedaensis TaxID=2872157 RepID=A0ABY4WTQ7_9GAMM|nr:ChaN family lipoprotein [Grimontia kaedaensis]USH01731.1 ChaN family lipoprotein [Grimontia kaedaensis]
MNLRFLVFSLSLLAGCSASTTLTKTKTLYDYKIESASSQHYSLEALTSELLAADVILVGEWHTHPGIHLFQTQLLATLASRHSNIALSMEQFSRADQTVLDGYLAGDFGENSLLSKTNDWPNYAGSYRPLVEYAKAHDLPVIAANAPEDIVRCIGREGKSYLDKLSAEERGWVAKTLSDEDSPYKEKFFATMFHGDETKTENQYQAQIAWDDTMAESIVDFLAENPSYKVMHIAGAFHVEGGLGIAARILARNPDLSIAVISPQTDDAKRHSENGDYRLIVNSLPPQWISTEEMNQAISSMRHGANVSCE